MACHGLWDFRLNVLCPKKCALLTLKYVEVFGNLMTFYQHCVTLKLHFSQVTVTVLDYIPSHSMILMWKVYGWYSFCRYFEGGVSSVYLWDLDHGFAGVVLIKKGMFSSRIVLWLQRYIAVYNIWKLWWVRNF